MPNKVLMTGNEAIARGAMEAGLSYAASYPGTPATEILQYLADNFNGKAEWSVNEKVALETAIGVSFAGRRALCSMKHVGLNVAADPLMTAAYLGARGGLVITVADDPGAYSSQNEQDTRLFAAFAKVPCFEPSDSAEAKEMTKRAFDLSELYEIPVLLRSLTRLSHTASPVEKGDVRQENKLNTAKDPARFVAVPSHVVRLHRLLNEKQPKLKEYGAEFNRLERTGSKKGIIAAGIGYAYAKEFSEGYSVLKVSFYPVNEDLIREFVRDHEEVWVIEEGEPFLEETARKYSKNVKGRLSGHLRREGELGPDAVGAALLGRKPAPAKELPKRPPVLCPGCGHRETFKALKAANPSFITGDIGCYTLGFSAPLNAMDSCLCMGASIGKAIGFASQGVKRVAAVIGDSTFMHSGITGLISAVYNKADILILILDNSSTAMTGHQPTPLTGETAKGGTGGKVDLEALVKACGAASVDVIDPLKQAELTALINKRFDEPGVKVIIPRRECIFVKRKSS
jgi:indolepyruvate ferredoxin oxidoreductase, alpha subunit